MKRHLQTAILKDLNRKIVLLSGPRQTGKTTLAKSLGLSFDYLNWDFLEDRVSVLKKKWDRSKELVIFDELHKMEKFKSWLKGVYDKEGIPPAILVTGSARLDIAKKMGDSLAGRFFPFRLYPLDLWEISKTGAPFNPIQTYERLLSCSGFPEPFLNGEESYYRRWAKTHLDMILRQDLLDLESVRNIGSIETLVALLQTRVGSTVSFASLSRDLQVDPKTVRRWLDLLENLFVIFRVPPFHKNIARSLLKEPKYYFFDQARVKGDEGQKAENLVALALKKQLDTLQDVEGCTGKIYFIRTRDKREVDFLIDWEDSKVSPLMIEVKLSDGNLSSSLSYMKGSFEHSNRIQLVKNLDREKHFPSGEKVLSLIDWLAKMPLRSMYGGTIQ